MTETQARRRLTKMLERFTAGSILHLLADVFRAAADDARQDDDDVRYEQFKSVERTLVVVGAGVDAAKPE